MAYIQPATNKQIWVKAGNVSEVLVKETPYPTLDKDQQILVRVDRFGLSANNVTYGLLGQSYQYFDFFPTSEPTTTTGGEIRSPQYGIVPVWGTATVVASNHAKLQPGARIYGYLPMSQFAILDVSTRGLTPQWFYVNRPHLPDDRKVYNQYFICAQDPFFDPRREREMMLFRPLYWTSYFLDDYLAVQKYYGARRVVVSSASSKTGFCFAWLAQKRKQQEGSLDEIVALTSKSNVDFVRRLGFYDQILTYDDLKKEGTQSQVPTIYVDLSGSGQLAQDVQKFYGKESLVKAMSVGMSHADGNTKSSGFLPGTEIFFAPEWMKLRSAELRGTLLKVMVKSWAEMMSRVDDWIHIDEFHGVPASRDVFAQLAGAKKQALRVGPDTGIITSLWERGQVPDGPWSKSGSRL
ncbi:hypothetical protein DFS34DRAFT_632675 [Phlyctochytrium arcticum]|nr:hypothetical protein DFS34DRAFT_632675 [Phlyctochytrium arcticum]